MYNTSEFLEQYKSLERWAESQYGDDGIKTLEQEHHDRKVQAEVRYFRSIRNVLSHNPNGSTRPLIELTDEFKERFEALCGKLMNNIADKFIPYKEIYKREMSDKVLPTISTMKERSFSYVPVMNGKKIWGVFGESTIFDMVSGGESPNLQEGLQMLSISKYITKQHEDGPIEYMRNNASIDDVRKLFADALEDGRRIDTVYFTTTGDQKGDLVGMLTIWDLPNI